jgi:undecaprenyl-diphosphatase
MNSKKPKSKSKYQFLALLIDVIGKRNLLFVLILLVPFIVLAINIWGLENKPLFWQQHFVFDRILLDGFHEAIPPLIGNILKVVYIITGAEVTAFTVVAILAFFVKKRYWKEAIVLALSTLGILLTNDNIIKPFFLRLRPEGWLVHVTGRSFPSGHVMGNFLLYFYVAYILTHYYPKQQKYFYGIAIFMVLSISLSSLYVRVHWVTDVLAGYAVGYIWLIAALAILKLIDKKYRH